MLPRLSRPSRWWNASVLLLLVFPPSLSAQQAAAAPPESASLDADVVEQAEQRWGAEIAKLEQRDRQESDPENAILFVGSSSIRLWDSLAADMAPYATIQRGYGGAKYSDVAVFAPRLLTPHAYRALVLFVGNDVSGSDADHTPAQVADWVRSIIKESRDHQPEAAIFIIEITPSARRYEAWPEIRQVNNTLREVCLTEAKTTFIPTAEYYLDEHNQPRVDLFREDRLHLNSEGYELWSQLIKRRLDDFLSAEETE